MNRWNDAWFEAHSVFVYETFLYIIASLIKTQLFDTLHEVFAAHYFIPVTERYRNKVFDTFTAFCGRSEALQSVLAPEGRKLRSPAAEFIKLHANRKDIPFKSIIEADLLCLMVSFLKPDLWWYPQTLYYAPYSGDFTFFLRATEHKYFMKLAIITGVEDADKLRELVKEGLSQHRVQGWFMHIQESGWESLNMERLDTLK